jgi:hypothetical protein
MMYLRIAEVAEVDCGRESLPFGAAVGKGDPAWTEGLGSLTKGVASVEAAVTDCADPLRDRQGQKEWVVSAESRDRDS